MSEDKMKNSLEELFSDFSAPVPEAEKEPEPPSSSKKEKEPSPVDVPDLSEEPPEDLQTWRQRLVRWVLLSLLVLGGLGVVVGSYNAYTHGRKWLIPLYVGAYGVLALVTFWGHISYDFQAGTILALMYGLGVLDLFTAGRSGDGRIFLLAFSMVAVLFFGQRVGILAFLLSMLTMVIFAWAFSTGLIVIPAVKTGDPVAWFSVSVVFFGVGILLLALQVYLVPRLAVALNRSRELAQNLDLHRAQLEERTQVLERQAVQLKASAEVGRVITSIFDLDRLLHKAVRLIGKRFGFYHVGIFLLDESGKEVVLEAATGEIGRQMETRDHRLTVDENSIVGWTALHRKPYTAFDVGEDAVHFNDPFLPDTRSQLTLPMIVGGRLLGVLDIQSTEEAAFEEGDLRVLQGLADQIAVAIQNARRVSDEAALLEATSPVYRVSRLLTTTTTSREVAKAIIDSVAETEADGCLVVEFENSPEGEPEALLYLDVWRRERKPAFLPGVRLPISESPFPVELVRSFRVVVDVERDRQLPPGARQVFQSTGVGALVNIPLRTRDEVIGQVVVLRDHPGPFSDHAIRLYEALSDQASVALERARLVERAQRRAERERQTRQMLDRIRRAMDVEQALRTTAEELATAMDVPHVSVELNIESEDGQTEEGKTDGFTSRA